MCAVVKSAGGGGGGKIAGRDRCGGTPGAARSVLLGELIAARSLLEAGKLPKAPHRSKQA